MTWTVWVLLVAAALVLLDRAALAAEARGWIHWRRRKAAASSVTNAFQSVQSIFEPAVEHAVEERADAETDDAEDDDPEELASR